MFYVYCFEKILGFKILSDDYVAHSSTKGPNLVCSDLDVVDLTIVTMLNNIYLFLGWLVEALLSAFFEFYVDPLSFTYFT